VNILIFSAVLQLGLLLLMVEIFHRVTFAGVGLNALAIPVMTLLLALALPTNLLSVMSPALASWPAKALTLVISALFSMVHLPGPVAWLSYRMPTPPAWVAWGFCGAFVLAGVALRFARRAASAALATCAVFVVLVAFQPIGVRVPKDVLQLTMLDCGFGQAFFLVLPGGKTMLLDAGDSHVGRTRGGALQAHRWNSGEDIVSPYLWSRGIKGIDVVVLTHPSPDNLAGMKAILDNFHVGEFWNLAEPESPEYAALLETVAEHDIPTRALMPGDALAVPDVSIRVLGPDAGSRSVAGAGTRIEISGGGMNFLLTADSGKNAEETILAFPEAPESRVLDIAHHRSKAANGNFVAGTSPSVVIDNSGSRAEGREYLTIPEPRRPVESVGPSVFHTGTDGATTVEWKDGRLTVRTYRGSEKVVTMPEERGNP
jgi:competence protein ComEC